MSKVYFGDTVTLKPPGPQHCDFNGKKIIILCSRSETSSHIIMVMVENSLPYALCSHKYVLAFGVRVLQGESLLQDRQRVPLLLLRYPPQLSRIYAQYLRGFHSLYI